MPRRYLDIDKLLANWQFRPGQPLVRRISGRDGRPLLQMRVDMGILQLEAEGRPDGERPHGFDTFYDYLVASAFEEGEQFELDAGRCVEVDREFYQFYHRRVCWLSLKEYGLAAKDAQHSLKLMDFSSANAPDPKWALMHEQYRPFVVYHRVQAEALAALEQATPQEAVALLDAGLSELETLRRQLAEQRPFDDAFLDKLRGMRTSIVEQYDLGPTLAEQLAEAIAAEQYERAAAIRDQLQGKPAP
jgi:hypothetical protein